MKINKGIEVMTRRNSYDEPDFRISSERVLKLGNKQIKFHLDFWFRVKNLK
jgi:hypothetical protein